MSSLAMGIIKPKILDLIKKTEDLSAEIIDDIKKLMIFWEREYSHCISKQY